MRATGPYGPADFAAETHVSRETLERLSRYSDLLIKWQKAKNLVSNTTLDDRWRRHFLDSAQLLPLITRAKGQGPFSMLDIGSGAGFPGLVLAIMGLGRAHMVEANGRKCVFMNQVIRDTGADAQVHNERIEALTPFDIDIVTSRACAKIDQLIAWSAPFLRPGTEIWLLKGETWQEELTQADASWNMSHEQFASQSSHEGVILRLYDMKKR